MVFGANTKTVLIESYESLGDGAVASVNLDYELEEGAQVERIVIADDAADAISVIQADVRLASGAQFSQTILAAGAKRQRFETWIKHPGQGASVRLDGVYLVGDRRHADITTVVDHEGAGGTTSQLTKGAVAGSGCGVFQGRIVVERGADQTDARMGHHALILSDRGEVDAKPELLIYADDVQCAHGNTVGALDEDALFYARQRGIPEDQARAMLTEAFIGQVIDRIEHEAARDLARAWVADKLRGLA
jgi:Fe-S cluster assembly protein SufD